MRPRAVQASRLVGRARELDLLSERIRAAAEGRGGVVFVAGEAGIGKSRLAREAAEAAREIGLTLLSGRAVQASAPVAYRPLAEALCSGVRRYGTPDGPELEPFRPALGRLIPEWRGALPEVEPSIVTLSEGIVRFLRSLAADSGCLLILEDLHWADPESLSVVEYLADNLTAEPVVCLVNVRGEEPSGALDLIRRLQSGRTAEVIEPGRLTESEVAEMVASCLGTDSVSDEVVACAKRSDGVPFLVEELVAVAVASGSLVEDGETWSLSGTVEPVIPLTFADGIRRRLAGIDDDGRAVVFAAAVLGRRFDWTLLPTITGLSEDLVLGALHAAVDAQIVSVDADDATFRFRHALSRDAVVAALLPPERTALCARALEAVESAPAGLDGDAAELAAELAERAGNRPKAAGLLLEAGRRALDAGALATAEGTLDRARMLAPSDDPVMLAIEETLAEVLSLAGKRDRAVEVCESLLNRLGDAPAAAGRRAEVQFLLGRAAVAATQFEQALSHLDRARTHAQTAGDGQLSARAEALAAQAAMGLDRIGEAAALARSALEASQRLHLPEVACEALEILGRCDRPLDLAEAEAAFAKAHAIAEEHGLALWRARALHELGTIDLLRGHSLTRLEEARRLALSLGALATAAVIDVQISARLVVGDDPAAGLIPARRAADLARKYGLDRTLVASLGFEAHAYARAGRRDLLDRCELDARAVAPDAPEIDERFGLARGMLALVEEDRARAIEHLRSTVTFHSRPIGDRGSGPVPGIWALLAVLEGEDAGDVLTSGVEQVHFVGKAYVRYARAVLAGRQGRDDAAVELVAKGDRLLDPSKWFRHLGRRLVAEAALADGWGAPQTWLREGLAFFQERGDERIASACRSLLRQAGVAVPRRRGDDAVPSGLAGMGITARELEVLRLLADGLANRDIAARLYLSPRTVERHIANLATKIGVEGRAQVVAFAARNAATGLFGD